MVADQRHREHQHQAHQRDGDDAEAELEKVGAALRRRRRAGADASPRPVQRRGGDRERRERDCEQDDGHDQDREPLLEAAFAIGVPSGRERARRARPAFGVHREQRREPARPGFPAEFGQQPVALGLAAERLADGRLEGVDPALKVACREARRHEPVEHATHEHVGQIRLERVADLDPRHPRVREHEQHDAVATRGSDPPRARLRGGPAGARAIRRRRVDEHGHLEARIALERAGHRARVVRGREPNAIDEGLAGLVERGRRRRLARQREQEREHERDDHRERDADRAQAEP